MSFGEGKKRDVGLIMSNHRCFLCRLKRCLSDVCHTSERAAQNALFSELVHEGLLSHSSAMSGNALFRKRGQIERAREAMLRKTSDTDDYNMSEYGACENIKVLKARKKRKSEDGSEWLHKQQRFNIDGEGRDNYVELFLNEVETWAAEEFLGFNEKSDNCAGEKERYYGRSFR